MDIRGGVAVIAALGLALCACERKDSKSDAAAASTPPAATMDASAVHSSDAERAAVSASE